MPKRRNKGISKRGGNESSSGALQKVEQGVDGVQHQGNGSWNLSTALLGAAALALSGFQVVSAAKVGQKEAGNGCEFLKKVSDDGHEKKLGNWGLGSKKYKLPENRDEFDKEYQKCIKSLKNNGQGNETCQREAYKKVENFINSKENKEIQGNLTQELADCKQITTTTTTTTTTATTLTSARATTSGIAGGDTTQFSDNSQWSAQGNLGDGITYGVVAFGFFGLGFFAYLIYYFYKKYCGESQNTGDQEQELQDVVTHDGGPRNGDDKNPSVREQLLDGKNGDRGNPNVGPGGKHKCKKKQLSRTR